MNLGLSLMNVKGKTQMRERKKRKNRSEFGPNLWHTLNINGFVLLRFIHLILTKIRISPTDFTPQTFMSDLVKPLKIRHEFGVNKHGQGRSDGDSLWTDFTGENKNKKTSPSFSKLSGSP